MLISLLINFMSMSCKFKVIIFLYSLIFYLVIINFMFWIYIKVNYTFYSFDMFYVLQWLSGCFWDVMGFFSSVGSWETVVVYVMYSFFSLLMVLAMLMLFFFFSDMVLSMISSYDFLKYKGIDGFSFFCKTYKENLSNGGSGFMLVSLVDSVFECIKEKYSVSMNMYDLYFYLFSIMFFLVPVVILFVTLMGGHIFYSDMGEMLTAVNSLFLKEVYLVAKQWEFMWKKEDLELVDPVMAKMLNPFDMSKVVLKYLSYQDLETGNYRVADIVFVSSMVKMPGICYDNMCMSIFSNQCLYDSVYIFEKVVYSWVWGVNGLEKMWFFKSSSVANLFKLGGMDYYFGAFDVFMIYDYFGEHKYFFLSKIFNSMDILRKWFSLLYLAFFSNDYFHVLMFSMDVMHSWGVPKVGLKMDVVPGKLNSLSFSMNTYLISKFIEYFCYEYCGKFHSYMQGGLLFGIKMDLFFMTISDLFSECCNYGFEKNNDWFFSRSGVAVCNYYAVEFGRTSHWASYGRMAEKNYSELWISSMLYLQMSSRWTAYYLIILPIWSGLKKMWGYIYDFFIWMWDLIRKVFGGWF